MTFDPNGYVLTEKDGELVEAGRRHGNEIVGPPITVNSAR
jgi:hypothetical protein